MKVIIFDEKKVKIANKIQAISTFRAFSFLSRFELVDFVAGSAIGSCSLDTINIGTQRSGREIGGQPEWNVQVINNCDCPQKKIVLSCPGFQTVEPVDPSILSKQGDTCLLINGGIVQPGSSVSFSYAWDPPVIMFPRFSVPQCPT